MSLGAVLVILVAAGDARTVSAETFVALVSAAQSALPKDTSVHFFAVPEPDREDLSSAEERLGARAVASLSWRAHPGGVRAFLRMHVAGDRGWTERTIVFSARDAPAERGRTLGFAIASMWPGPQVPPRAGPPPVPPPPPPRGTPTPPANDNARGPGASRAGEAPPVPTGVDAPSATAMSTPVTAAAPALVPDGAMVAAPRREVGLGIVGATGLGGPAGAVGGTVDLAWRPSRTVALRGLVELRGGALAALPGVDWLIVAGAGVAWWPRSLAWSSRGAFGLYGDLLGIAHVIRRRASTEASNPAMVLPAETHARVLPAFALGLLASLRLGPSFSLQLGLGGELALGRTDLRTGEDRVVVATIPPARAVGRLSLHYAF